MKKLFALLTAIVVSGAALAQTNQYMRVWMGEESTRVPLGDMVYGNGGKQLTVGGTTYNTAGVDSITVVHTILVNYSGATASVDLGTAQGVTAEVKGADVVLTNTNVNEEMEFVLSGTSANGSLTYNGSYKCKFHLNGLNLTSAVGAPLDIECGKRVDLLVVDGTENSLSDAANGSQKACLYCKGHLEIDGSGSLTISGNARHAISTKEYLRLKKNTGSLTIAKAASDAIHAGQYFMMNGGHVKINNMAGDGIQAEITSDAADEFNGQVFIKGGSIDMTVASADVKGIKSDADMAISGGTININVTGAGSKGISCPTNMVINEDSSPTEITVYAAGKVYEDPVTDESVRCMGIKVDGNLTISAGKVTVYNTGSKSRGIKVGGVYKKTGTAIVSASISN